MSEGMPKPQEPSEEAVFVGPATPEARQAFEAQEKELKEHLAKSGEGPSQAYLEQEAKDLNERRAQEKMQKEADKLALDALRGKLKIDINLAEGEDDTLDLKKAA